MTATVLSRYVTWTARAAFVVLLIVAFTATTPLWLTALCAAAAMPLIPIATPEPEEDR